MKNKIKLIVAILLTLIMLVSCSDVDPKESASSSEDTTNTAEQSKESVKSKKNTQTTKNKTRTSSITKQTVTKLTTSSINETKDLPLPTDPPTVATAASSVEAGNDYVAEETPQPEPEPVYEPAGQNDACFDVDDDSLFNP